MITAKLDVTKIDKSLIFVGKVAQDGHIPKYIDIVLHENRQGVDKYGNVGFVAQQVSKEARERGEKGAILGNYKIIGQAATSQRPALPPKPSASEDGWDDADEVPF